MLINITYAKKRKPFHRIVKESNRILGVPYENNCLIEYDGMMISYGRYGMQVNTLLKRNADLSFLADIISMVFKGMQVGISGLEDKEVLSTVKGVKIYWI